jgi:hypothetical protein
MPSPFPGMDPWLESPDVFPDIHDALIYLLREGLNAVLPKGFRARGANRIWMDEEHHRQPDVSVVRPPTWAVPDGGVATEAYTRLGMLVVEAPVIAEPAEERYVEIVSAAGDRLVTAVEVLSPSNKLRGNTSRAGYLQKQGELRSRGVNLVEIDLLRAGTHTTAIPLDQLRQRGGAFDYHVCVTPGGQPGRFYISPIRLADRLPTVAIPLEGGAGPVSIDLQPLLDRAYDTGRHGDTDYREMEPVPPLTPEQQTWAEGILKAKGVLT